MSLVRHIALLFALVIATITVSLTPSPAQAHDGRAHAATTHAVHSATAEAAVTVLAAAHFDCSAPCCAAGGHHGSCCCATGLAPAGIVSTLPPSRSAPAPSREHAALSGIVPEALPEPPRPFA